MAVAVGTSANQASWKGRSYWRRGRSRPEETPASVEHRRTRGRGCRGRSSAAKNPSRGAPRLPLPLEPRHRRAKAVTLDHGGRKSRRRRGDACASRLRAPPQPATSPNPTEAPATGKAAPPGGGEGRGDGRPWPLPRNAAPPAGPTGVGSAAAVMEGGARDSRGILDPRAGRVGGGGGEPDPRGQGTPETCRTSGSQPLRDARRVGGGACERTDPPRRRLPGARRVFAGRPSGGGDVGEGGGGRC